MADTYTVPVPPAIANLVQTGLIERAFHDALYPALIFRNDALAEEWEGQTGVEVFESRAGLLAPATTPLTPGVDPTPKALTWEQWVTRIEPYGDSIDTHMPTARTAAADLFMQHIQKLGLQAGETLNRLPRDAMSKAYLGGQTTLVAATATGDTTIRVSAMNGFTDVVNPSTTVRPVPVSTSTPLQITITDGSSTVTKNVIGASADDPTDMNGPGTLTLSATVGVVFAARSSVLSAAAPTIIRSGGGTSVDAIGSADTLTLQDCIAGANVLRAFKVQPHSDGYFHVHLTPAGNTQIFADPVFQRLNQSLPEHVIYKEGFVGCISGMLFYMNTENPGPLNSGTRTATSASAFYSHDIGAETTNHSGINLTRTLITGRGVLKEKWLDESKFITEAGVTGKIGEFSITNNSVQVMTDRIRLIIRSPLDRLQNMVASTWSYSGGFPVPSDITSTGPQRFKRAMFIESAG